MTLRCPYCQAAAELVGGDVIYPHRPDLASKFFWRCAPCDAYVGCHPTGDFKTPLGRLADAELRREKMKAHAAIDPYWRQGRLRRGEVYAKLAFLMNLPKNQAHIGMFDVAQCKAVQDLGKNTLLWESP